MKMLVFSDTHGNSADLNNVISNYPKIDLIVHLGDIEKDVFKARAEFPGHKFEFVAGNNDWSSDAPDEKLLELGGKNIFITHGHRYNVKFSTKKLVERGHELGADLVLFGHTHLTDEFYSDNMLILNPGSLGLGSLYQGSTFCEITIKDGKILTEFKSI